MEKQRLVLGFVMVPILLFAFSLVSFAMEEPNLDGYYAYKTFNLDKKFSGCEGMIVLYLDKKLSAYRDPSVIWDGGNPPADVDRSTDFKNALLCIVSNDGKTMDELLLEKPHAGLSVEYLYGNEKPTYIVERDFTAESGTYSGPGSMFAEITEGKITLLKVKDKDGKQKIISLGMSLKNSWKIIPAKRGKGKDIIIAQYHPDYNAPAPKSDTESIPFVTEMTRYYFDGKKWNMKVKIIKGGSDFEDDSAFPDISIFP